MCAHYTLRSPADLLAVRFGLPLPPDLKARFNIAPSKLIPVIGTKAGGHGRGLALFKWGFVPHWAQRDAGTKPVNARAETVATTPMFSESFRLRRCIIPADGFYEWKTVNKKKMPVYFRLKSGEPFVFAGLWDVWNGPQRKVFTAAIITPEPNELTREVMGPAAEAGGVGYLWKRVAWLHGELALLDLWRGGVARNPDAKVGANRAVRDLTRGTVAIKALLLADGLEPVADAKLLTNWAKTEAAADAADERSEPSPDCLRAMTLVETLGMGTTYGGPAIAPQGLPHADLRAAEELALDLGMEPPPGLASMDIKYPEHEYK
jgi:hypothetical protein